MVKKEKSIRLPAEIKYATELAVLKANDTYPKPEGWDLSPRMVVEFIDGSDKEYTATINGKKVAIKPERKFYGERVEIEKCVASLASELGLMLVGPPGTAKSMLSELLACAISNDSTLTIQGTSGTTEDQIKYSWNFGLLPKLGICEESLIPAPLLTGIRNGKIVRFEELTRCPSEVQDTLISILSDKVLIIPEFADQKSRVNLSQKGHNVIGTANTIDRGINETSSALKRRFSYIYIMPIKDLKLEISLVERKMEQITEENNIKATISYDVLDVLTTTFKELREGVSSDGGKVSQPTTVMSTAQVISVGHNALLHAEFFGGKEVTFDDVAKHIIGSIVKEKRDDIVTFQQYMESVVARRRSEHKKWNDFYNSRKYMN